MSLNKEAVDGVSPHDVKNVRIPNPDSIGEGEQHFVKLKGNGVYVTRVGGALYAADAKCPCPLTGGTLNQIVDHEGAPCVQCDASCYTLIFNLTTGRNVKGFDYEIDVYPTRIEDDEVIVG